MPNTTDSRISSVSGTTVVLNTNDIDTDRIIPARFLKHLTFDSLGEHVFEDDRKQDHARGVTHPFDELQRSGAVILLAAKNFGCGSSREHAAQALYRWGVRAVVGESFGEIFRSNCGTIGLPCVTLAQEDSKMARDMASADPEVAGDVDLEKSVFRLGGREYGLELQPSLREAFLQGTWDTVSELLKTSDQVSRVTSRLPYLNEF